MLALAPTPFDIWAEDNGYDITRAVSPCELRAYADRSTQEAFKAYKAGQREVARMVTESTIETDALRDRLLELAK